MKHCLFVAFIFLLFSCGNTKPKQTINFTIENKESLNNFLNDKGVNYEKDDLAVLRNVDVFGYFNNEDKLEIPAAYFFNKEGFRVKDNFKGDACGQVIKNVDQINNAPSNEKEHLKDWLQYITFPYSSSDKYDILNEDYDVYIIITWAKYADSLLKGQINETSFNWYKSVKENKDLKIKTIFLDYDIQEDWELTDYHRNILHLN